MDKALLLLLVKVTIFTLMFTLGINLSLERLRSLLAVVVTPLTLIFLALPDLTWFPPQTALQARRNRGFML